MNYKNTAQTIFFILSFQTIKTLPSLAMDPPKRSDSSSLCHGKSQEEHWQEFVTQNPESSLSNTSSDMILRLKQTLNRESRLNLARTCWGMQTLIYHPTINEFVPEEWRHIESKHVPWNDAPNLCFRTLSILNWRVMTILGLNLNMQYEPEDLKVAPQNYGYLYNLTGHNLERLKILCSEILEAPNFIVPEDSILRNYIGILLKKEEDRTNPEKIKYRFKYTIRNKTQKFHNEICLTRHFELLFENTLVGPKVSDNFAHINYDCSLLDVITNHKKLKILKETNGLYDVDRLFQENELRTVWKEILFLDFGATLLSYRLIGVSSFSFESLSNEFLSCLKRQLLTSKSTKNTYYNDLGFYCEALLQHRKDADLYALLEETKEIVTFPYFNFCVLVSRGFKYGENYPKEIEYLLKAKNTLEKLNTFIPLFVLQALTTAYTKTNQHQQAIHYSEIMLNTKDYTLSPSFCMDLATLYKKVRAYNKAGDFYLEFIRLSKLTKAEFTINIHVYNYALAAYAYCDGGKFEEAAIQMAKNFELDNNPNADRLERMIIINLLAKKYDSNAKYLIKQREIYKGRSNLFTERNATLINIVNNNFIEARKVVQTLINWYREHPEPEAKFKKEAEFFLSFIMDASDKEEKAESYFEDGDRDWMSHFYWALKYFILAQANHPAASTVLSQETLNQNLLNGYLAVLEDVQTALNKAKENGFCWQ